MDDNVVGAVDGNRLSQTGKTLSFEAVQSAVLGPRCVSCHSNAGGNAGGANLETYEAVKQWLPRIEARALVDKTMPRGNPLSESEAGILKAWISTGAGLSAVSSASSGSPTATPAVLIEPRWTSVRSLVLAPKCMECHSQPHPVSEFDVLELEAVRGRASKIFEHVVIKKDMPPSEPLNGNEMKALVQWMLDGMAE